ncbi:hypothetical protein CEE37_08165 [candidate division LCP-89 bacterium B3_LCP]|uniref:Demethylmenaquinone methyltransferase n=1 Tax=candidate division LCP-89 bacterium B3_LCP TaxID=2012998 RepID=A0A532UZB1_UNCL8|nr:MAG: hypothetical protein CEE37_08165 [candidate division LCP-89 bacterium B3_LCP]
MSALMCPDRHNVVSHFDRIAPVYDHLNSIISWRRDKRWRSDLARWMNPRSGQIFLDISAGTGDMENALKAICPRVEVIGIDPSIPMLELYRKKVNSAKLTKGVAESLPLQSESVDGVICTFGIRNFQDRLLGFKEIHRVLKPGSFWGFLEMSTPHGFIFPHVYSLYFKRIVPLIGRALSSDPHAYQYLRDSVYQFPGLDELEEENARAGFTMKDYRLILRGAVILAIFQKE